MTNPAVIDPRHSKDRLGLGAGHGRKRVRTSPPESKTFNKRNNTNETNYKRKPVPTTDSIDKRIEFGINEVVVPSVYCCTCFNYDCANF